MYVDLESEEMIINVVVGQLNHRRMRVHVCVHGNRTGVEGGGCSGGGGEYVMRSGAYWCMVVGCMELCVWYVEDGR